MWLLLCLSWSVNRFKNKSYAVGIWSGKETVGSRVLSQARTWFKFWDEVFVFSDSFPPGDCDQVRKEAHPCTVKFIEVLGEAEHLEGTKFASRWALAQPRFLPAMARLYELNPNADFFVFGDDDTFLFKEAIVTRFSAWDPSALMAAGHAYCLWKFLEPHVGTQSKCVLFLQGGAGVVLSNGLLKKMHPHLELCSVRFNDAYFASNMRFGVCAYRLLGEKRWAMGRAIHHSTAFHSQTPEVEMSEGPLKEPPASFHKMTDKDFVWLANKCYVTWTWSGRVYRADLGVLALVEHRVPVLNRNLYARWEVGVRLHLPIGNKTVESSGSWRAILASDGSVRAFEQSYAEGINMRLIPEASVPFGRIIPVMVNGRYNTFEYAITPPEVRDITPP